MFTIVNDTILVKYTHWFSYYPFYYIISRKILIIQQLYIIKYTLYCDIWQNTLLHTSD